MERVRFLRNDNLRIGYRKIYILLISSISMRRKVIPIGEVRYESEGGLVEVDGVIEETSNGQFVDPQKRTYFGGRINEDGLTESSGFYSRERTDNEKRADLER